VNPAFSSVTGVPEDAVIGKRVHEIIPEPSLSFVLDRYREAIQERKIVRWEETSDYPTGRLTGEVSVAPVFDASGTCTHLVGAVHDITERKRTEVEREQLLAREQEARAEVERLNAELEQRVANRTEQLEAANKELEAFSYSVAHDLRAPLRAIDGFSRLVVDGYGASLPDDARRYLDRVQQGARHMGELIDDLLTFSQLARQPLRRQQIDTRHLVEQVIAHLQPEHAAGTAAIRVAELPSVEADPALLRQVFANVLSNALKFTRSRAEPRIDVTHQADGGEVVFVVRDNGVGFDMRYVDKLFGVFQRLHRAEDYEGTGVGLAIVQRIIHRHGGRVWAEAEIDKGAAFYFTLGATDDGERSS
ncbi:MAG TPA: ATP-binding protein, partial [bacterium]|nr:ATP-binding protein [bacterium]